MPMILHVRGVHFANYGTLIRSECQGFLSIRSVISITQAGTNLYSRSRVLIKGGYDGARPYRKYGFYSISTISHPPYTHHTVATVSGKEYTVIYGAMRR